MDEDKYTAEEKPEIEFTKRKPGNIIWDVTEYVDGHPVIGKMLITFDKKKFYNIYGDYPDNMTAKEREIFEKEYPDWVRWLNGEDMLTDEEKAAAEEEDEDI